MGELAREADGREAFNLAWDLRSCWDLSVFWTTFERAGLTFSPELSVFERTQLRTSAAILLISIVSTTRTGKPC